MRRRSEVSGEGRVFRVGVGHGRRPRSFAWARPDFRSQSSVSWIAHRWSRLATSARLACRSQNAGQRGHRVRPQPSDSRHSSPILLCVAGPCEPQAGIHASDTTILRPDGMRLFAGDKLLGSVTSRDQDEFGLTAEVEFTDARATVAKPATYGLTIGSTRRDRSPCFTFLTLRGSTTSSP